MSTFRDALTRLPAHQKSSRGVSFYTRVVNRPAGRVIAASAYAMGLSANAVTVVSGVISLGGVLTLVLARPSAPLTGVVAALLLCLGFAFDSADGQVARLTGRSSPAGEWLDHLVDTSKMVLVHTAVLIAWYRFTDLSTPWLLVPLAYQLVSVVMFVGLTVVTLLKQRGGRPLPVRTPSTVSALLLLPADYGVLCLSFLLWHFTNLHAAAYLLLLLLNTGILAAFLRKWFRELKALGPE